MARRLIRRRLRALWPNVTRRARARPRLRDALSRGSSARRPSAAWPSCRRSRACCTGRPRGRASSRSSTRPSCRCPNVSVDRVLLVHAARMHRAAAPDAARGLARDARRRPALVVVPNRRGIWARIDRTPFGQGHPYAAASCRGCCATTCSCRCAPSRALFMPPSRSRWCCAAARRGSASAGAVPAFAGRGAWSRRASRSTRRAPPSRGPRGIVEIPAQPTRRGRHARQAAAHFRCSRKTPCSQVQLIQALGGVRNGRARPPRSIETPRSIATPSSSQSSAKSRIVQRWMLAVSYHDAGKRLGHRHAAARQELPAHPPMGEIGERDDGARPMRTSSVEHALGSRVACSVWLRIT